MGRKTRMTCAQAALLLGVDEDASVDEIQSAWRVWVRLAHPDTGGDRQHFDELMRARHRLLAAREEVLVVEDRQPIVPPREALRTVVRRPAGRAIMVMVALVLVAVTAAVLTIELPAWVSAAAMGTSATVAAIATNRMLLGDRGDVGHRITLLVAVWSPLAVVQVAVSVALGSTVIVALPVLALPLAVAVALVNPGAGLWRPARFPDP